MKKLTAMLLSLMMCFSLMAIPAQAAFIPNPDGPVIIDVDGPKDPADPGDEAPDGAGTSVQPTGDTGGWPGELDGMPVE